MTIGADPGFPVGGGADPPGGTPTYNFVKISNKNCMKSRTFWALGPPLDPPLDYIKLTRVFSCALLLSAGSHVVRRVTSVNVAWGLSNVTYPIMQLILPSAILAPTEETMPTSSCF